jgi:tetratricopeptide (TPR) repeat protein
MSELMRCAGSAPRRRSLAALLPAAAFLLGIASGPVLAADGERAERLYSRALVELHAGRTDAALVLFDESVATNPDDPRAFYYRGLALGQAGRFDDAAADLRRVVEADGNLVQIERAPLELAYVLHRLGRDEEALPLLDRAAARPATSAEASLLSGILHARRGDIARAHPALSQAIAADPSKDVVGRYYMGLASWRGGDQEAARENFSSVVTRDPGGAFGREASAYLDLLGGEQGRSWRVYGGAAFEYDTNVALAPDDDALANTTFGISDRDDGRAVLTAGGAWAFYRSPKAHLSLGYDLNQSLHFELDEFDVQSHKLRGQAAFFHGPVSYGLTSTWEYSFLDFDDFHRGGSLLPWLRFEQPGFGRSEVYYRMRTRDFVLAPFDGLRDSTNHAAGGRQFFNMGARGRDLFAGYRFEADRSESAAGRRFDFDAHQVEAGIDWSFDFGVRSLLVYAFRIEDYASASGGRDDDEHHVSLRLEKEVTPLLWVTSGYTLRLNDSNRRAFDYSRHITSLGLEVRY